MCSKKTPRSSCKGSCKKVESDRWRFLRGYLSGRMTMLDIDMLDTSGPVVDACRHSEYAVYQELDELMERIEHDGTLYEAE